MRGGECSEDATRSPRVLLEARISVLPVVEEGRLLGIVTATDLLERHADSAAFAPS
jgi:CBS domain-containing protein